MHQRRHISKRHSCIQRFPHQSRSSKNQGDNSDTWVYTPIQVTRLIGWTFLSWRFEVYVDNYRDQISTGIQTFLKSSTLQLKSKNFFVFLERSLSAKFCLCVSGFNWICYLSRIPLMNLINVCFRRQDDACQLITRTKHLWNQASVFQTISLLMAGTNYILEL